jgi:hypothetical protein
MATYEVTHEDGRKTRVNSDSGADAVVKKQANHAETSRAVLADRRGLPRGAEPSLAVSVTKVKD